MICAGLVQRLSSLLVRGVVLSFSARQGASSRTPRITSGRDGLVLTHDSLTQLVEQFRLKTYAYECSCDRPTLASKRFGECSGG